MKAGLPKRTYEAIRKQLNLGSIVATKHTAIVETIKPHTRRSDASA